MFKTLSAVAVAALTMVGGAQAMSVSTIDLFNTKQTKLTDTTVGGVIASEIGSIADASILGGFREIMVDQKVNAGSGEESTIGVSGGLLKFSNEFGASATGIVRWDGATASTGGTIPLPGPLPTEHTTSGGAINVTGLGGLDIGNVFTDSFELKVTFADGAYFFRIDAYTDATHWSTVKIQANQHALPITSYIPLLAFLDCTNSVPPGPPLVTVTCGAAGAVDFDNLGALQAVIDVDGTAAALDLALNQVTVVPEPNAIALVGLALLGAGLASRRRKA